MSTRKKSLSPDAVPVPPPPTADPFGQLPASYTEAGHARRVAAQEAKGVRFRRDDEPKIEVAPRGDQWSKTLQHIEDEDIDPFSSPDPLMAGVYEARRLLGPESAGMHFSYVSEGMARNRMLGRKKLVVDERGENIRVGPDALLTYMPLELEQRRQAFEEDKARAAIGNIRHEKAERMRALAGQDRTAGVRAILSPGQDTSPVTGYIGEGDDD